jgi:hypothetical protein
VAWIAAGFEPGLGAACGFDLAGAGLLLLTRRL